jgi:hypothetical protein
MTVTISGATGEVFPSWTTSTRPSSPTAGQTGYNTTLNSLETYNGSVWATNSPLLGVVYENGQSISTSYTMTSGKSGMSTGPVTVANGVTVTVPTGSRWVIL